MPSTMNLEPLQENGLEGDELKEVKLNYYKIKCLLDEMKYGEDITFHAFLDKLKLTEEQYIQAIQYLLQRTTLLLRRAPSEVRINNYNSTLLNIWKANMDIQFVLEPYACAVYILFYITKGPKRYEQTSRKSFTRGKCWK